MKGDRPIIISLQIVNLSFRGTTEEAKVSVRTVLSSIKSFWQEDVWARPHPRSSNTKILSQCICMGCSELSINSSGKTQSWQNPVYFNPDHDPSPTSAGIKHNRWNGFGKCSWSVFTAWMFGPNCPFTQFLVIYWHQKPNASWRNIRVWLKVHCVSHRC